MQRLFVGSPKYTIVGSELWRDRRGSGKDWLQEVPVGELRRGESLEPLSHPQLASKDSRNVWSLPEAEGGGGEGGGGRTHGGGRGD